MCVSKNHTFITSLFFYLLLKISVCCNLSSIKEEKWISYFRQSVWFREGFFRVYVHIEKPHFYYKSFFNLLLKISVCCNLSFINQGREMKFMNLFRVSDFLSFFFRVYVHIKKPHFYYKSFFLIYFWRFLFAVIYHQFIKPDFLNQQIRI